MTNPVRSTLRIAKHVGVIAASLVIVSLCAPPAFAAAGDLDTSFGGDGKVAARLSRLGTVANALAIQPDGKIVAVGTAGTGSIEPKFALARYNADGTLDTAFGHDGTVETSIPRQGGYANAIAIQSDGKIVVAGKKIGFHDRFVLARYNADGALDTSFGGGDGWVKTGFGGDASAFAAAVQGDGKIILGGGAEGASFGPTGFALARYNNDGTLDTSFDGDGKVTTVNDAKLYALAIQPDGKIVAAGSSFYPQLARYNSDGTLDMTFGEDGQVTTFPTGDTLNATAYDIALQADGRIVTAGGIKRCGGIGYECSTSFFLARYDLTGALDTGFGNGGMTGIGFDEAFRAARALAIQTDGRIVAAGVSDGSDSSLALVRYNTDGTFDTTFGGNGRVLTDLTPFVDQARAVAIQADGKVVAAGGSGIHGPNSLLTLTRYLGT